jgi:hypothetical protein
MANGLSEPSSLMDEAEGGCSRRVAECAEKSKTIGARAILISKISNVFGWIFNVIKLAEKRKCG